MLRKEIGDHEPSDAVGHDIRTAAIMAASACVAVDGTARAWAKEQGWHPGAHRCPIVELVLHDIETPSAVTSSTTDLKPASHQFVPRSAHWTAADQLADECHASPGGGHTTADRPAV